jgi:4-amino-4-deoxy-L-arabinose transferase-like glycosyltransferase
MRKALLAAVLAGLALRFAAAALYRGVPLTPGGDDAHYYELASDLAAGHGLAYHGRLTAYRGPLYPAFLAAIISAGGGPDAARSVQAAWSSLVVLGVLALGAELFSLEAGLWAAALLALYPEQILLPTTLHIECFYSGLVLAACAAWARWSRRPAPASAAALGLCLGVSLLCRSTLFPALLVWAAFLAWRVKPRRARLAQAAACAAALVCVMSPWWARNAVRFRRFIPFEAGVLGPVAWYASQGEAIAPSDEASVEPFKSLASTAPPEQWDAPLLALAARNVKDHPFRYALSCLRRIKPLWLDSYACYLLYYRPASAPWILAHWGAVEWTGRVLFLALVALAAAGLRRRRDDPAAWSAAALAFSFNACLLLTVFARHQAPAAPLLCLLAGAAWDERRRTFGPRAA